MRTNNLHLRADPAYGYLLLGQEDNRRAKWGIVAVVTMALIAGLTPRPQHLVDTSATRVYRNNGGVTHV